MEHVCLRFTYADDAYYSYVVHRVAPKGPIRPASRQFAFTLCQTSGSKLVVGATEVVLFKTLYTDYFARPESGVIWPER